MKSMVLLPVAAAFLFTAIPALAQDGPRHGGPRGERGLVEMLEHKRGPGGEGRAEKWKEEREKVKAMSPEEREKFMEARHAERRAKMEERIKEMPPEKQEEARAKMAEFDARREKMREELMALPPEEREAKMEEMHEKMKEEHKARRAEAVEKTWEESSAEERKAFCDAAATKCGDGEDSVVCAKAKTACGVP